jgi:2-polyprenyl-3-methyl-5-hydroxy-6-metoxy-1,4-benzoquinol methylase
MPSLAASRYELLTRVCELVSDYRFVAGPIEVLRRQGSSYSSRAERHLRRLHAVLDHDDARFDDAIEAFVEMTVDVMRMQDRYFRTGQFDAGPELLADGGIYSDADLMGRRYLCGLYLAQVLWPNHLAKLEFFEAEFVPLAIEGARVLEVGTGPGTYGLDIGRSVACADLLLNDISPLSVELARRMATADPVLRPETLRFSIGDFLALDEPVRPFDLVLFSEVLEHLPDPRQGLERLRRVLAPGAAVFFSTATNAAFYDHTIVFETVAEVTSMLSEHGLTVATDRTILAAEGPDDRDVMDYVAVLTAASSR